MQIVFVRLPLILRPRGKFRTDPGRRAEAHRCFVRNGGLPTASVGSWAEARVIRCGVWGSRLPIDVGDPDGLIYKQYMCR